MSVYLIKEVYITHISSSDYHSASSYFFVQRNAIKTVYGKNEFLIA